jgi:hypothetical protein
MVSDSIGTLATALKHFDLDQIYIRRAPGELLDRIPEQRRFKVRDNRVTEINDSP